MDVAERTRTGLIDARGAAASVVAELLGPLPSGGDES